MTSMGSSHAPLRVHSRTLAQPSVRGERLLENRGVAWQGSYERALVLLREAGGSEVEAAESVVREAADA